MGRRRHLNWNAVGAVGEITGAIAVVLTLFYLARQIRDSTRLARAEMTKDIYLCSVDAIRQIASNDRMAAIWADMRDFPDEDAARRYAFYQAFFRLYELQFNLARRGLVEPGIETSYGLVIAMFSRTRHFEEYWSVARGQFHEDFASYVDEQREPASPIPTDSRPVESRIETRRRPE